MASPKASIIVLNWNGKHYLKDCLSSIAEIPREPSFECIMVDNGSTDGSVEYVEKNFKWVRVVRSGENLGYAGGNNLGAREAKGEFLIFLNYDTRVEKNWLSGLLDAFKENRIAAVQSKVLFDNDSSKINTFGTDTHVTGLTVCKHIFKEDKGLEKTEEVSGFSGSSVMIPKRLFFELGGFDDDFFLYLEDTDFGWRATLAGHRILATPKSIIYHKYKLKMNPKIFMYNERNRQVMILKNYSAKSLALLFPSLFLMEIFTHAYALYLGPSFLLAKLSGDFWVLGTLPRISEKRSIAQKLRKISDKKILEKFVFNLPIYRAPWFAKYFELPFNLLFRANYSLAILFS